MTIIQFNKNSWQGAQDIKNEKPKAALSYSTQIPQQQADTFEFQDYELEDKPSFFEKLQQSSQMPLPTQQLQDRAQCVKCEALLSRNEAEKLIFKAANKDYCDIITPQGNIAVFGEDELGRGVMQELDRDGNVIKETTFFYNDGTITSIIEMQPNSNKYTKTAFFNHDNSHFEITKGKINKLFGKKPQEVFGFRNEELTYYRKGKNVIINEEQFGFQPF